MLKSWTYFEKAYLILGTLAALVFTYAFNGTWIDLGYTLLYSWTAILFAKGKYACYIVGLISIFFYTYVSFTNHYYGEVIITLCLTLPLMLIGLINWIKHQDNVKRVKIKDITIKEFILVLASQVILFGGYYYLLKIFNTENSLVSTFSIVASLIANYLAARRSNYCFAAYIINDLILIVLWGIPVIQGNLSIIPVLLCPTLLLINDIYGVYNWKRIKKEQKELKGVAE